MIGGMDRYFQIARCFRDEDLRADRQPEFTQIDCEMAFVTREDILNTFEGLTKHLYQEVLGIELDTFPRMSYDDAIVKYGSDKPDTRFGMEFVELNDLAQNQGFSVFDHAELVVGVCAPGIADSYSNKDINELTDWVKRPQIGAKGLVYIKYQRDGSIKSSIGKFYSDDQLLAWGERFGAQPGDLVLILAGEAEKTRTQLGALRLEMGERLGLRDPRKVNPLWVVDFPLLEWDEEAQRFFAMHHPFTSPKKDDIERMQNGDFATMKALRADAYDLVLNGVEIGGGSIRIHSRDVQQRAFSVLGIDDREAQEKFGFLLEAFKYGPPPHGGIAFGWDRIVMLLAGANSLRNVIAFPKTGTGQDPLTGAPTPITPAQRDEAGVDFVPEDEPETE